MKRVPRKRVQLKPEARARHVALHKDFCHYLMLHPSTGQMPEFEFEDEQFEGVYIEDPQGRPFLMGYPVGTKRSFPSRLDLRILLELTAQARGCQQQGLQFRSRYDLVRAVGLPNTRHYYDRCVDSLMKWRKLFVEHPGQIVDPGSTVVTSLKTSSKISLEFSYQWYGSTDEGYFCLLDLEILKRLRSGVATSLYLRLRAFDQILISEQKLLRRKLQSFCKGLGVSTKARPDHLRRTLTKGIDQINEAIKRCENEGEEYHVEFPKSEVAAFGCSGYL